MWKPAYVHVADPYAGSAKEYLRIPTADTQDDARLALDVEAASRAIDRATGRQFGQDEELTTRLYTPEYDCTIGQWIVRIDDLMSVADLVVTSGGTELTTVTPWPLNALADGRPYTELRFGSTVPTDRTEGGVSVLERFGWTAIPTTIKDATLLQMARFFKRSDAPFGVAGSPEAGSELRLLAKVDPDVAVMVSDYVRRWFAA